MGVAGLGTGHGGDPTLASASRESTRAQPHRHQTTPGAIIPELLTPPAGRAAPPGDLLPRGLCPRRARAVSNELNSLLSQHHGPAPPAPKRPGPFIRGEETAPARPPTPCLSFPTSPAQEKTDTAGGESGTGATMRGPTVPTSPPLPAGCFVGLDPPSGPCSPHGTSPGTAGTGESPWMLRP